MNIGTFLNSMHPKQAAKLIAAVERIAKVLEAFRNEEVDRIIVALSSVH